MADHDTTEKRKHRPSAVLLLAGLVALGVSAWALTGPTAWNGGGLQFGWVLVVAAIVVGAVLVISPGKKK